MSDDTRHLLESLRPRGADAGLRAQALAAVDRALDDAALPDVARRPIGRWERAAELAAAASLVIGIGWNAWHVLGAEAWRARVFGEPTTPSAVTNLNDAVASVTGDDDARSIMEHVRWAIPRRGFDYAERYPKLLNDILSQKEPVL